MYDPHISQPWGQQQLCLQSRHYHHHRVTTKPGEGRLSEQCSRDRRCCNRPLQNIKLFSREQRDGAQTLLPLHLTPKVQQSSGCQHVTQASCRYVVQLSDFQPSKTYRKIKFMTSRLLFETGSGTVGEWLVICRMSSCSASHDKATPGVGQEHAQNCDDFSIYISI